MAFLAIPAVTSGLATIFGTTAAPIISSALTGAVVGGAGNAAMGGDWKRGALKGGLGAAGGAGFGSLLGGAGGAGASAAGEGISDLASVGMGSIGSAAGSGLAESAIGSFLGDAARQGASNVVGQALVHAATPKTRVTSPQAPLPPIEVPDSLWEDLVHRNTQFSYI